MSPRSGRQVSKEIPHFALSHASRARLFASSIRGSASLHPRLYASTRYAGFEKVSVHAVVKRRKYKS
jgi:hypothetical protein